MTRYQAYATKDWREHGEGRLIVIRTREGESADYGEFLLDIWCLGVKDAFGETDLTASEIEELLEERFPEDDREAIHPACAKKLVEGAVAYAESLGFAPHRDFRKARRVLSGLDGTLCPTEFTFGRDGRPCFVPGPDDTDERIDRVLAILDARVGPEGYDYEDDEEEFDAEDARDALIMFFDSEPDDGPTFAGFAGAVAAMLTCPTPLSPLQLLEVLWGPQGRPWADEDELKDFMADVQVYWNDIALRIRWIASETGDAPAATNPDEPRLDAIDVFAEDFENTTESTRAMVLWARGFLRVTELWPDAWGDALGRDDLTPHWAVVRAWADPEERGHMDIIKGKAHARLPDAVSALVRALRGPSPEALESE